MKKENRQIRKKKKVVRNKERVNKAKWEIPDGEIKKIYMDE